MHHIITVDFLQYFLWIKPVGKSNFSYPYPNSYNTTKILKLRNWRDFSKANSNHQLVTYNFQLAIYMYNWIFNLMNKMFNTGCYKTSFNFG